MEYSLYHLTKRILKHARPFWPHITGLFFLTLLATPIALIKPLAMKLLIDSAFGSEAVPGFITMFFPSGFKFTFNAVVLTSVSLVIIIALIDAVYSTVQGLLETFTGEKLVLSLRTVVFNHIQRISLAYHDKKGTSDSLYRLQWDTIAIRSLLLGNLSSVLSSSITLLSMIVVMFLINPGFAWIAMCVIPPLFLLTRFSRKRLKKGWREIKQDESFALSVIHEVLGSLRVVKAFGQEDNEEQRYVNQADKAIRGQLRVAKLGAFYNFAVGVLFASGTALFIFLGASYVHSGQMTLGELTMVLAYLSQVFAPLQNIAKNINSIQSSILSIERVFSLLDQEKEVEENLHSAHLPRAKGSLEFQNVSFLYEKDKLILKDVSFQVKSGDRVGIMGSTGAGKTTLISLLMRFYDPSSGKIFIDGENVRNLKLADYRSQFSMVLQDPVLFSTTIGENIRYGRPEASEKDVIDAAKSANAHHFIMNTHMGYETMVGERGMQLSGGERQRISLARAFIKNAPILILDEPTSSLDIKTEAQIMEAMELLMEGRTTFMITHRLDTLNSCNIILHLENGRLVEVINNSTPDKLIRKKEKILAD